MFPNLGVLVGSAFLLDHLMLYLVLEVPDAAVSQI